MRLPSQVSYLVTGTATLALLAGCAGGSGTSPIAGPVAGTQSSNSRVLSVTHRIPANSHSVALPGVTPARSGSPAHAFVDTAALAKAPKAIAVSDAADNVVNVYNSGGTQIAQLTGFSQPQGMAGDAHGNLYVADTSNSRVQVYGPGFQGSPTTLSDPGQYPAGVDSFGSGAYVAVTNIISTSGGPGSVSIFHNGSLQSTITSATIGRAYFCAFDAAGNLYLDGTDPNGNIIIGEIANATSGGTTFAQLTYGNTIAFPGGVQVNNQGQIVVDDQSGSALYTYNAPVNGSLGSPVSTTSLSGVSDPVTFSFTKNTADLYTADAGLAQSQEFAYPAGGAAVSSINVGGQPIGVVVFAPQFPTAGK